MCGVAAIWHHSATSGYLDLEDLEAVTAAMARRGPDDQGIWIGDEGRLGMGHRRLAIIGLGDQGHQPMELAHRCHSGAARKLVVSYNGEIYNYGSLRQRLLTAGHRMRTSTDTEVLLHLYEEMGPGFVRELRGMFAFTLWDEEQQALYLARDPLGIKPLYYSANTTAVSVASQAKALLASRQVSAAGSDAGLAGFLLLGSVPEPLTAWSSIESVEAGTFVRIERGGTQATHRYYSLPGVLAGGAVGTAKADLSEAFRDSVAAHLVADVEVGLFLSAGIDSASLLGLAAALGHKTRAVTLGFSEYAGDERDETPVAADAAKFYGASHTVRWVSQVEMLESVPEVLADMDQPSVDGLNTWLVARATAEQGLKVALSGIGGDELLGGYSTFRTVPSTMRLLRQVPGRARLGPVFRRLSAPLVSGRSPKLPGVLEYGGSFAENWFLHRAVFMPWDLPDLLGQERARSALSTLDLPGLLTKALTPRPPSDMAAVSALETALYMRNQLLRDADWAGMAHSLEIRVPLSDSWLVQSMAGPLSQEWGPRDGKQALGAAPTPPLPGSVVDRPKSGFAVPVGEWVVSDPNYSSWRRNRVLIPERCPWARRWAYVVADRFGLL